MTNTFRKRKWLFIPIFIAAVILFGGIVMALWNAILPAVIPGVKPVSFLQALGILVLSKILFGGFHGGWREKRRARWAQMQQKLSSMTPEEREKFKSEWRDRCSGWKMRSHDTTAAE